VVSSICLRVIRCESSLRRSAPRLHLRRARGNTGEGSDIIEWAGLSPARRGKQVCFRDGQTVLRGKPHPSGSFGVIAQVVSRSSRFRMAEALFDLFRDWL